MRHRVGKNAHRVRLAGALGLVTLTGLVVFATRVDAAPQPYTSSGGELGPEYVLQSIRRILPEDWVIAEQIEDTTPFKWSGPENALLVKLEDQSIQIHHPNGFKYHPFLRLYFCPSQWQGTMEEADFYGNNHPAFLLGKNHVFTVFYQSRGKLTWENVWDQLAVNFDLTRPPVGNDLLRTMDLRIRQRLAQRLSSVSHGLRDDTLDRLLALNRQGNLLYVEYVARVSGPAPAPGAPPLPAAVREIVDEETEELATQMFRAFPEVSSIYMRRLCDNRLFDTMHDRQGVQAVARSPAPRSASGAGAADVAAAKTNAAGDGVSLRR